MPDQKPALDYETPQAEGGGLSWAVNGCFIGCFLTPPALFAAMLSAGAGHGHYVFARAVFPIMVLATLITHDGFTPSLLMATVLQIPAYGFIAGWSVSDRRRWWIVI